MVARLAQTRGGVALGVGSSLAVLLAVFLGLLTLASLADGLRVVSPVAAEVIGGVEGAGRVAAVHAAGLLLGGVARVALASVGVAHTVVGLGAGGIAVALGLSAGGVLGRITVLALLGLEVALGVLLGAHSLAVGLGVAASASAGLASLGGVVALGHLSGMAVNLAGFLSASGTVLQLALGLFRVGPVASITTAVDGTEFRRAGERHRLAVLETTAVHARITGHVVNESAAHAPTALEVANSGTNASGAGWELVAAITRGGGQSTSSDSIIGATESEHFSVEHGAEVTLGRFPGVALGQDVDARAVTSHGAHNGIGSLTIGGRNQESVSLSLSTVVEGQVNNFESFASIIAGGGFDDHVTRDVGNHALHLIAAWELHNNILALELPVKLTNLETCLSLNTAPETDEGSWGGVGAGRGTATLRGTTAGAVDAFESGGVAVKMVVRGVVMRWGFGADAVIASGLLVSAISLAVLAFLALVAGGVALVGVGVLEAMLVTGGLVAKTFTFRGNDALALIEVAFPADAALVGIILIKASPRLVTDISTSGTHTARRILNVEMAPAAVRTSASRLTRGDVQASAARGVL
jgi:hypothetical protein